MSPAKGEWRVLERGVLVGQTSMQLEVQRDRREEYFACGRCLGVYVAERGALTQASITASASTPEAMMKTCRLQEVVVEREGRPLEEGAQEGVDQRAMLPWESGQGITRALEQRRAG